jgi:hypothetical protein
MHSFPVNSQLFSFKPKYPPPPFLETLTLDNFFLNFQALSAPRSQTSALYVNSSLNHAESNTNFAD